MKSNNVIYSLPHSASLLVTVVMITLLLSSAAQLVSFAGHGNAKNTHVTKWIFKYIHGGNMKCK